MAVILFVHRAVAARVNVLKAAAKIRKVPAAEVLASLAVIKKEKAEPPSFLETLGRDTSQEIVSLGVLILRKELLSVGGKSVVDDKSALVRIIGGSRHRECYEQAYCRRFLLPH